MAILHFIIILTMVMLQVAIKHMIFFIILKDLQIQKILVQKEKKVVVALLTMLKMVVNKG